VPEDTEQIIPASPDQKASGKNGERTQKVVRWFLPAETVAVIKKTQSVVTIGSGAEAREVVIRPLTPLGFVKVYGTLKKVLVPLMELYRAGERAPALSQILHALGDNVGELPSLLTAILERGNEISEDWVNKNLDLFLDMNVIIPAFIEQNGLEKLFGGKGEAPETNGAVATENEKKTPLTLDSEVPSVS
jgi:hypothetical protein